MTDSLQHVGVLGMHWGRRKGSSSSPSADYKVAANLRKKKLHEMSNEEIRVLTGRMQLENNYKSLNPGKLAKGKRQLEVAVATIGTLTTAAAIAKKSVPVVKEMLKKARFAVAIAKNINK